jgi:hypothetical protein
MTDIILRCKNCGAPFNDKSDQCAYCGKVVMKLPFMIDDDDIDVLDLSIRGTGCLKLIKR